jgi:tricorn protease
MSTQGYYRFPAIYKDDVVFVSEDDLWTVPVKGGVARRLTANLGAISFPYISPDGKTIAFTGREEGNSEVYVMPFEGGPVKRVTYLGAMSSVQGWTPDGKKILFASNAGQPFGSFIYAVSPDGGLPEPWPVGMAVAVSIGKNGRTVIGRNHNDPARWKRYRGGTAGDLWVDEKGHGEFHRLITLKGNLARPMYIGKRIYFVSDHEGVGNLYSCLADGSELKRHTDHVEYFVRFPSTDGESIVYHAGGDLYVYNVEDGKEHKVKVQLHSPRVHRQRKFVDAGKYLESADLHPQGHSLAVNARGKSFTMGDWEGPVVQQNAGDDGPIRSRLTRWLNDGERVVTVTDVEGVDFLEIHDAKGKAEPIRLEGLDIGRARGLEVSPKADQILISNHRNELLFVDLAEKKLKVVDKSEYEAIGDMDWAPDGVWAAYSHAATSQTSAIKLWNRETGEAIRSRSRF